jgi:hypothetical protein
MTTFGQRAFEVEWCNNLPFDECGDGDFDHADCVSKVFRTKESALDYARKVFPLDVFGSVSIREVEYTQYEPGFPGGYWDAIGNPEEFDGNNLNSI